MDVEDLLGFVASLEANYEMEHQNTYQNEMKNFGHPENPNLALQKLSPADSKGDVHLVVTYTKHCVAAQVIITGDNNNNDGGTPVIDLGSLTPDPSQPEEEAENETIQHLLIVELENVNICSSRIPQLNDTTSKSHVLAVVLGTNQSRLLVAEVLVQQAQNVSGETISNDAGSGSEWAIECLSAKHGSSFLEVLPCDTPAVVDFLRRKNKQSKGDDGVAKLVPFLPSGGVSSLFSSFDTAVNPLEHDTTYVWVAYKDGNIVRMHHAALFPSVWAEGGDANVSVDDLLLQYNHTALFRCQVRLPPGSENSVTIVPLPRYHPSPLAPVSFVRDIQNNQKHTNHSDNRYEALVFGSSESFPTFCVYTSEDHFWEPQLAKKSDSHVVDAVLGGTKALVGGVVGAFRWATKGSSGHAAAENNNMDPVDGEKAHSEPTTPFPSVWHMPVSLFAGSEYHDVPRIVENCAIDPDGHYAALADGLGRVLLFDLSTKQILRMWKGLRQASCVWAKVATTGDQPRKSNKTYLVIHSKQRRVVEVWRAMSGDRLSSFHVNRDSAIVPCPDSTQIHWQQQENKNPKREFNILVLDSIVPAGAATVLKKIDVNQLLQQRTDQPTGRSSSREATMRVQHLKQLLSSEHATKDNVFEAFCQIKSLVDLSSCLDLVASATVLEREASFDGSAFQKLALDYCVNTLGEATKDSGETASAAAAGLSKKIDYYTRLIKAYDLLRGFGATGLEEGRRKSRPISSFAREGEGWADVYEKMTKRSLDADLRSHKSGDGVLRFSQFASSCVFPPHTDGSVSVNIYFSESTRTRQELFVFLFHPLLGWFSSGVVGSVFEVLGIRQDFPYLLKCFGEWFLGLRRREIQEKCLNQQDSPMSRFLRDVLEREFDLGVVSPTAMSALSSLSEESTDLVRAFMLAALACEVQRQISQQKEEATFASTGTSKQYELVKELDQTHVNLQSLLRKLRVCLLVSLRLCGQDLAPFPLSVRNIEREQDFSVFKLIALDELIITEQHQEIVTMETACRLSTHRLNPFSSEADKPEKFRRLQESCLAYSGKTAVTRNPDKNGSLLLFFATYNRQECLAAHRALLLALEWIKHPKQNHVLQHSIDALESLSQDSASRSLAYATTLDVWSRVISPIYRARLFGFSDVPEIREDDLAPLMENHKWLGEFGRMALQILMLLSKAFAEGNFDEAVSAVPATGEEKTWPPVKADYILDSLMKRHQKIETTALETHVAVVCALLFSDDRGALTDCIPALGECFHPASLSTHMNVLPAGDMRQATFLSEALVSFAYEYKGSPIDSFGVLGELEILANRWAFDQKWLRTTFLIAMYEFGKDSVVDELMTSGSSQILPQQLIVAGINIACRRLDHFLKKMKSTRGPEARSLLGLLDAELCEWIRERAESSEPLVAAIDPEAALKSTQILTIRLLSLASNSNAEADTRTRIHALSVLSGTLVKATGAP